METGKVEKPPEGQKARDTGNVDGIRPEHGDWEPLHW